MRYVPGAYPVPGITTSYVPGATSYVLIRTVSDVPSGLTDTGSLG
ncbi:UNVERIFIED_CONTAM: hypothetical protein RKD50_000185 [Streptomyces canus]